MIVVIDGAGVPRACGSHSLLLKRVIGLPGDTVAQRDGLIYIGGHPLAEAYLARQHGSGSNFEDIYVQKNAYFVLGDNRARSCDSRAFGPVPRWSIRGAVVAILEGKG
jgi:signal peptidase I